MTDSNPQSTPATCSTEAIRRSIAELLPPPPTVESSARLPHETLLIALVQQYLSTLPDLPTFRNATAQPVYYSVATECLRVQVTSLVNTLFNMDPSPLPEGTSTQALCKVLQRPIPDSHGWTRLNPINGRRFKQLPRDESQRIIDELGLEPKPNLGAQLRAGAALTAEQFANLPTRTGL